MNDFRFFTRKDVWLFIAVAALAMLSFLGSVLLAFADGGRTPWFRDDAQGAALQPSCATQHGAPSGTAACGSSPQAPKHGTASV